MVICLMLLLITRQGLVSVYSDAMSYLIRTLGTNVMVIIHISSAYTMANVYVGHIGSLTSSTRIASHGVIPINGYTHQFIVAYISHINNVPANKRQDIHLIFM